MTALLNKLKHKIIKMQLVNLIEKEDCPKYSDFFIQTSKVMLTNMI